MFGLTFEKLFVVALLAVIIIGPRRLPGYAAQLGAVVRRMTALAADTRQRVTQETDAVDWRALDPRQYDPRRIIREAWSEAEESARADAVAGDPARPPSEPLPPVVEAPAGQWIVSGSSAHPRRVWVPAES